MGSNIASERIRKGLTQSGLCGELSISVATLKAWEQGKRIPGGEALMRMADLFGCTTDYLLGRTEERVA